MKKNVLTGIILLMTVSLVGIVAVQYFWVSNAIRVKEQQFDQSVSRALSNVTSRLKKDQDVLFVSNQFVASGPGAQYEYTFNDSVVWSDSMNAAQPLILAHSKGGSGISSVSVGTSDGGTVLSIDALRDDTVRYKTILKLDSLKSEYDNEYVYVMTELKDSLDLIVKRTLSQVNQNRASVNEAIDDMVVELKSLDEPLSRAIDPDRLARRMKQSMEDEGIGLNYEYAVYDPETDSLTGLGSPGFSQSKGRVYKTRLFPASIFDREELLLVSFPGKRSHILRSMGWLLAGSGVFTGIILFTFFITIRVILRQKKLSAIKTDFINNMTHEFKTPIATISLAVDSINNPSVIGNPERIRYFTGVIGEENQRMNSRVENVLQMSLIETSEFKLHPEQVDMHDVIGQATRNAELQVKKKEGTLRLDLQASDPVIFADRAHILGVLTNLLDNALKYSSGKPEIHITSSDSPSGFIFSVKDNGVGMTREEQNKIFDKFYRVSSGDIHNVKGFGLGLSYVKAIILTMKGDIDIKSQPGKGTTFTVKLPR